MLLGFLGEFQHNIDAKGRLIVPAKFRVGLGENFVVTKGMDGCLFVYSFEEWSKFTEKMKDLPLSKVQTRQFTRHFFASASESELDKQGRVNIPVPLREYANLEKTCVVVGVNTRLEIWDKSRWDEMNQVAEESFDEIADSMTDFGF
ncbi:MAG: division/cell wall cluster transcriptional repressor MraZ [Streptococcaceae bacterium]|jgi:MraZ protein|nr:division/cell wall cluster transcriptional repressor MraZ [Streptococcaceae bacterium]